MNNFPCLIRSSSPAGEARFALGDPLVDSYLAFVAGRSRPNTLRAVAHDLKTFFTVVDNDPVDVVAADVFDFLAHQRGDRTVIRLSDGESGLSARTIARRLSSVSGLYAYLIARGDTDVATNPVPRGLSTRRRGGRSRSVPEIETASMAKLRTESHARMLGNGLCTRPVELDCRMESACETCAYFQTSAEFTPVLLRQRNHARDHDQPDRAAIFDTLLERVAGQGA